MRNRQSLAVSLLLGGLLVAVPLIAQAGGTIKGKVTYSGKAVKAKSGSPAKRASVSLWANRFMRVRALNPARRRGASPCCFNSPGRSFWGCRGRPGCHPVDDVPRADLQTPHH